MLTFWGVIWAIFGGDAIAQSLLKIPVFDVLYSLHCVWFIPENVNSSSNVVREQVTWTFTFNIPNPTSEISTLRKYKLCLKRHKIIILWKLKLQYFQTQRTLIFNNYTKVSSLQPSLGLRHPWADNFNPPKQILYRYYKLYYSINIDFIEMDFVVFGRIEFIDLIFYQIFSTCYENIFTSS